jgi:hypothetical protein
LTLTACGGIGDWWSWYSVGAATTAPRDFATAPATPLNYNLLITEVTGDPSFVFGGMAPGDSVDLYTIILDAPSSGLTSTVQIRELSGTRTGRVVFRGVFSDTGNAIGSLSADAATGRGLLKLTWNGTDYAAYVNVYSVLMINRTAYTMSWVYGTEAAVDPCGADASAPTIAMPMTGASLWPANHKMVRVAQGIGASDDLDSLPTLEVSVTSSEPVTGPDDDTTPDWVVSPNGDGTFDVWVRAERRGSGDGRVYTITATATDACGKTTTETRTVSVPKSMGRGK